MLNLAENASLIEKLGYGFKIMLLGMGTVFAILLILYLVLAVFQFVFTPKAKKETDKATSLKKQENAPVPTPVAVADVAPQDDENELVAVIMAAVYAASGAAPGTLRMISCKKRQKTPWNRK